jgi:hypothetical protein
MVFLLLVVFGFSTKPLTMIRLFAELSGHYQFRASGEHTGASAVGAAETLSIARRALGVRESEAE